MGRFVLGMIVGAALLHGATNYHVVRAQDGFHFIRKSEARIAEAYIDIRNFGIADWAERPGLALAITNAGKQHLIGDAAATSIGQGVNQLLEGWPAQPTQ